MSTMRAIVCLYVLACAALLLAQTPPKAYTITELDSDGTVMTYYRLGTKVLLAFTQPAQSGKAASPSYILDDFASGNSASWDPGAKPVQCTINRFSGDWGDPFGMIVLINSGVASGDLKPAYFETVDGIMAQVYTGSSGGTNLKAWLDQKDGLVLRFEAGAPNASPTMLVNITKVSFTPPLASLFILPAACAGVRPAPTPDEVIAAETGDEGANWVTATLPPGSASSCSIVLRVVAAKTMAPIDRQYQAAIDTTYDPNSSTAPDDKIGLSNGTVTYSGGGIHEITSQIRNGMLRLDNPPAAFIFGVNFPGPNYLGNVDIVYRQCFAPVTMLYYVVKDPSNPGDGGDFLYAKAGKYAVPPTQ